MEESDIFGDISRMHQKQVIIHAGDEGLMEAGRILYVEPDWTTDDLLQAAGRRLEMVSTPKRMFDCNGTEVADVMMIEDREVIFFTNGADYVAPIPSESGMAESNLSSSGLPAIVGAYKVCEFLGKGGFGEVRIGQHQLTEERVALKFLRKSAIADLGAAERTTTEIQCLTSLKHPNIIRLVQHINSPQNVIMVFELAEGGDLYQFLSNAPEQRVGEDEGRAVFRQIVSGVGYAHNQHICHRDMKLDNVLLSHPDCLREVKLADFGLSGFYRPGATMRTNCGSISYLAPEVFRGTSNAGPPLDVWSIGVILFALLCGRLPFEDTDLQGTNSPTEATIRRRILECRYKPPELLSPEAKDLLRRMFKLDPKERASIPEIFNHSWLRLGNVTSLGQQSERHDDRGGLKDAFQDGPDDSSRRSPPPSIVSRESNSPRLPPLSSRATTPLGATDCKAQASPRPSGLRSPRRYKTELSPQDFKALDRCISDGEDKHDEGLSSDVTMAARGKGGVARRVRQQIEDNADEEYKKGNRNRAGSDSDSDDSRASRTCQGGLGRDFSTSIHSVRGASPGSGARDGLIRMNSRLGLTHPARSKTISGLGMSSGAANPLTALSTAGSVEGSTKVGSPGGAVCQSLSSARGNGNEATNVEGASEPEGDGGVVNRKPGTMKSRTINLSHHLPTYPDQSPRVSPRLPSSSQRRRLDTIRQISWPSGVRDGDEDRSGQREDEPGGAPTGGGQHRPRMSDRKYSGKSVRTSISGSLPPLSPKATSGVNHNQGHNYNQQHKERGWDKLSSRDGSAGTESVGCPSARGDGQKISRESVGSPVSSPCIFDGARTGESWGTWAGCNQWKEMDPEDYDGSSVRFPLSPCNSLTKTAAKRDEQRGDDSEGKERS